MLGSKKHSLWIRFAMIFMLGILFFSSCSLEKKLAKKFVNQADKMAAVVLMPDLTFVVNNKTEQTIPAFFFEDAKENSDLLAETIVLSDLSDEIVLGTFSNSYMTELSNYGIKVYAESDMAEFMKHDSNSFMLNIAQVELMEFTTVEEDAISVGEEVYSKDIWLNGLNMAVWLELNAIDMHNAKPVMLFAENDLFDYYKGYFTQKFFTGAIEYQLTIDTITANDAVDFVHYLGRLYAAYTFDYILNNYLFNNLPESEYKGIYYRYDPYRKMFLHTEEDRFMILD